MKALAILAVACSAAPLQPSARTSVERAELRESVRAIANVHCASCHEPPGKPTALAVFDLTHADYAKDLDRRQLQVFIDRIDRSLNEADRRTVRTYLEAEAASR